MRDKRKSRWLQSCRLTLSALAVGQFIAAPVLAEPLFPRFM
jgi:phospholipase C